MNPELAVVGFIILVVFGLLGIHYFNKYITKTHNFSDHREGHLEGIYKAMDLVDRSQTLDEAYHRLEDYAAEYDEEGLHDDDLC